MRLLFCFLFILVLGCDVVSRDSVPPASMRVVEYKEITGSMPGPLLYVWLVADAKRDLCFVVFRSDSVAVAKVDCATVKPQPERTIP